MRGINGLREPERLPYPQQMAVPLHDPAPVERAAPSHAKQRELQAAPAPRE